MTRLPDGLTGRLNPSYFITVRPESMTDRPIGAATMGADALSDVLRNLPDEGLKVVFSPEIRRSLQNGLR